MPLGEAREIVLSAIGQLIAIIDLAHEGETGVPGGSYAFDGDFGGLAIQAHQWSPIQGPFTI